MSRHKVVSARVPVIEGLSILKKQYPKVADGAFLGKKTPPFTREELSEGAGGIMAEPRRPMERRR